ncbi:hypothetical protein [Myroides odoratus]|uniref:hypothetical protein n=1 Tax=Myroides odoratus TaxID=256 RepID=UPI0039AF5018
MKQRTIIMIACLCIGFVASAQKGKSIGIGVNIPDPSAIFHIQSEDQGLLIPNVIIQDVNLKAPINAEIKESLLVYNEGYVNVPKGYYYWTITPAIPAGKWIRVLTSEDKDLILEGQIQESFIEETTVVNGQTVGTGVFVYTPDKTQAADPNAPGRLVLDIPDLVTKNQTLTSFVLEQYELFQYSNGEKTRVEKTQQELDDQGIRLEKKTTELELIYTDEDKKIFNFAVKDLLGGDNDNIPAITNLRIDNLGTGLIFTNEKGVDNAISLVELVKKNETLTSMTVDGNDNLIFTNERGAKQQVNLRNVVREPWHKPEDNTEALNITDNIFTSGWVGIGLKPDEARAAINNLKPDEKLRINGSIYARNSYYADYVFDHYFTNEASALKDDYTFKDLATVESFIKSNYHLPGITSIAELEKSAEEGYLINVSELSIQLLEKVEELYLHTIEQQKIIDDQKEELQNLKTQFFQLEKWVKGNK